MSELQTETNALDIEIDGPDEVNDSVASQEQENQYKPEAKAEGAELATAEPEEAEKKTDDGESGDVDSVQRAINKQHRKFREEERKRLALEKELEELRKQSEQAQQVAGDIDIPPIPDPWDDDFDAKVKEREKAIQRKAQADYQRQIAEDHAFRAQQEQELKRQQESREKIETYAKRAAEQGIKEADLVVAANRVADAGVQPEVAEFLITDKDGPAITAYLADDRNVMELYELSSMSPVMAGIRLQEIRAKAVAMKPKASSAPPPPETVTGRGGMPETVSPLIKDASFE